MASLTNLMNLSGNALRVHQGRINVHSTNIANVDTEGYSRRQLEVSTAPDIDGIGMGVRSGDISRYYNAVGSTALLQEQSTTSYHSQMATYLTELETLVGGTVGSLDSAIENFQNSLQAVLASPEDLAARTVFLQSASTMASEFNQVDTYVQGVAAGDNPILGTTADIVDDINGLAERLQALNENIDDAHQLGRSVPDLLDERDLLVRELSKLVNIDVGGDYAIRIGGQELVSADGSVRNELSVANLDEFTLNSSNVSSSITGGKLAALVDVQNTAATLRGQIDTLADTLADGANALFRDAYNLNGTSPAEEGYALFVSSSSDPEWFGAQFITVDPSLYDPTNPMAARPDRVAVAATRAAPGMANPGDNAAGQALHEFLQTPQGALNGETIVGRWVQVESTLGGAIREAEQLADTSEKVLSMLDGKMLSVSGVNLDEELISMTSAQRAYEAAARVMSTASGLLDLVINQMR